MKIKIKKTNFDTKLKLSKLQQKIDDPAQSILIPSLAIIENDIKERISTMKALDDSPQKKNQLSTIKAKGHNVPLIDKSVYFNGHFQKKVTSKKAVEMMPPPTRETVITAVKKKGYSTFGISEKAYKAIENFILGSIKNIVNRYWK